MLFGYSVHEKMRGKWIHAFFFFPLLFLFYFFSLNCFSTILQNNLKIFVYVSSLHSQRLSSVDERRVIIKIKSHWCLFEWLSRKRSFALIANVASQTRIFPVGRRRNFSHCCLHFLLSQIFSVFFLIFFWKTVIFIY